MAKKPHAKRQASDVNQWAAHAVASITGLPPAKGVLKALLKRQATKKVYTKKNPAAVALGRLGGQKGGKARAESLSAKQRSAIARKAAKARWKVSPSPAQIRQLAKAGLAAGQIEKALSLPPGSLNRGISTQTKAKLQAIRERRSSKTVNSGS
jgi:hypothetical protein